MSDLDNITLDYFFSLHAEGDCGGVGIRWCSWVGEVALSAREWGFDPVPVIWLWLRWFLTCVCLPSTGSCTVDESTPANRPSRLYVLKNHRNKVAKRAVWSLDLLYVQSTCSYDSTITFLVTGGFLSQNHINSLWTYFSNFAINGNNNK